MAGTLVPVVDGRGCGVEGGELFFFDFIISSSSHQMPLQDLTISAASRIEWFSYSPGWGQSIVFSGRTLLLQCFSPTETQSVRSGKLFLILECRAIDPDSLNIREGTC